MMCLPAPANRTAQSATRLRAYKEQAARMSLHRPAPSLAVMSDSTIAPAGGDQPHNNMQPYLTLNFCIALQEACIHRARKHFTRIIHHENSQQHEVMNCFRAAKCSRPPQRASVAMLPSVLAAAKQASTLAPMVAMGYWQHPQR